LRGDVGGRTLIQRHPECVLEVELEASQSFVDIDTPSGYESYLRARPRAFQE
jgi:CTP:molybdopterin cytidylyltransferase MocA